MIAVTEVYLEMTPNPSTLKIVADRMIAPFEGGVEFAKQDFIETAFSLVPNLLRFPFVDRVFLSENYISVTKNHQVEWFEVQEQLRVFVKEFLQKNQWALNPEELLPEFSPEQVKTTEKINFEPSLFDEKINQLLNEYVQPAVARDGGEIRLAGFSDQKVYVYMQGSCKGCPSSSATLKDGVERLLKNMLPEAEISEVVALL